MTLIERHKRFHGRAIAQGYPTGVIALYNILLYEFNRAYWPAGMVFTERELASLSSQSCAGVHKSLAYLVERGHIKVSASRRRGTLIELVDEAADARQIKRRAGEAVASESKHRVSTELAPEEIPINARAKTPPPPPHDEHEKIFEQWRRTAGMPRLYPSQEEYLRRYSAPLVKKAIERALDANRPDARGNDGMCFAFVKSWLLRLTRRDKKPKEKELVSSERQSIGRAADAGLGHDDCAAIIGKYLRVGGTAEQGGVGAKAVGGDATSPLGESIAGDHRRVWIGRGA